MSKTYTRLTEEERYQIYEGVTEKRSHREIARLINGRDIFVDNYRTQGIISQITVGVISRQLSAPR